MGGRLRALGHVNKAYRDHSEPLVPGYSHVPYNNLDAMSKAVH